MHTAMRAIARDDRPRERLVRVGPRALSDAELVALLLGTGRRDAGAVDLAREVLVARGGLGGLASSDQVALSLLPGVGPTKAARLVAALELGRRRTTSDDARVALRTSAAVARMAAPLLADARRERVVALVCDRRSRLLWAVTVAEGAAHAAAFPVRDVLAEVLRRDGAAVALAHNHPGGDPTPSTADLRATDELADAAARCGIRLLDHVVVAASGWRSVLAVARGAGQPA